MDLFREALLKYGMNKVVEAGSAWMLRSVGKGGAERLSWIAFFGIFGWCFVGGVALANLTLRANFVVFAFCLVTFVVLLMLTATVWIMAVVAARAAS
jgi:hypothetical protein